MAQNHTSASLADDPFNTSQKFSVHPILYVYGLTSTLLQTLFGFLLNLLILLCGVKYQQFQNSGHYALAAVSVAYLMDSTIRSSLTFTRWMLLCTNSTTEIQCHVFSFVETLLIYACFLQLFVIALERFIAVMRPLHYYQIVTGQRIVAMSVTAWLIAVALMVVTSLPSWTDGFPCRSYVQIEQYNAVTLAVFTLPSIILVALYLCIWCTSWKQMKRIQAEQQIILTAVSNVPKHKATVTVGAILIIFFASWFLFLILAFMQALCWCVPPFAFEISKFFIYNNSVLNPLVFAVRSSKYRRAFKAIITCSDF